MIDPLLVLGFSAIGLGLLAAGLRFQSWTMAGTGAALFLVLGGFILSGGMGVSTVTTSNSTTNGTVYDNLGNLLETQNLSTNQTTKQTTKADKPAADTVGLLLVLTGFGTLFTMTTVFWQQTFYGMFKKK